jgi:hypothetical protein
MQQVMQTLESVTYYRMRLVKSLYDKLGTLAAPSIASFTACDKPRNLSAQCVCPETAGRGGLVVVLPSLDTRTSYYQSPCVA